MTTSQTQLNPSRPVVEPFASITEIQDRHNELVKEIDNDVLGSDHPEQIRAFVRRCVATGSVLDAREDRAVAQSLINFWTSRLIAATREARRSGVDPVALGAQSRDQSDVEDTLLDEFDPATISTAAKAAESWLMTLPVDDKDRVRRILLHLVRLSREGESFEPVPVTRAALQDLDPAPEKIDELIARLDEDGMVRISPGNSAETDQITLRDESLMTDCCLYNAWLHERLAFRERVTSWDQQGRPTAALLSGEELETVRDYHDRNPLERRFTEESRRVELAQNQKNVMLTYLYRALAAIALLGLLPTGVSAWKWHENARIADDNAKIAGEATGKAIAQRNFADERTQALRARQQLADVASIVRSTAVIGTGSESESDIAFHRLDFIRTFVQNRPDLQAFFKTYDTLESILKSASDRRETEEALEKVQRAALNLARRFKHEVLKNATDRSDSEYLSKSLSEEREVIFDSVQYCAEKIVKIADSSRPYHDADSYLKEFWVLYWGEMGLVEGPEVEKAMVHFGATLRRIDKKLAEKLRARGRNLKDTSVLKGLTNRQAIQRYYAEAKAAVKSQLKLEDGADSRIDPKEDLPQLKKELDALKQALAKELSEKLKLDQLNAEY